MRVLRLILRKVVGGLVAKGGFGGEDWWCNLLLCGDG